MNSVELQRIIGYQFKDPAILKTALNHSSYINESKASGEASNERLEFLGDAVFDTVISEYLYHQLQDSEEGELTKKRAAIVRESSLADCALDLGLGEHLLLGKGEEITGGRTRKSILADAMEAMIGAIYLDGGFKAAERFVLSVFSGKIDAVLSGSYCADFKTALQERLQVNGDVSILYEIEKEEGPDHDKIFYVRLIVGGGVMGRGSGRNKKAAEQDAARDALQALEE